MSVLFDNVKVGDTVHYSTPQGQTGKGKVVIHKGTHLVLNAGGRHGRPQVVTDKNYIKHSREGKVVGALLSRLSTKNEDYMNTEPHKWNYPDKPEGVLKLGKGQKAAMRKSAKAHDALLKKLHGKRSVKEETLEEGNIPKVDGFENFKQMAHDWAHYNDHHNYGHPKLIQKTTETNKVHHQTLSIGHHPRSGNPYIIGVFNHTGGPNSEEGFGTHHHHTQGLEMDEDSHDAEGAAERVAKTKKHKKKLHEVSTGTLASYVSKAIADRKKAQGGADMARRIHTPERAAYFVDKMTKKADKRSKGIKTAVAKIAKAYEETSLDEAKKKAKAVNWQSTKSFSVLKSGEGGMPLKHHMARLAAVGIPSRRAHSPYVGHTALEVPSKHEKKAGRILYGESVYIDEQPINEAKIDRYTTHHDDYMVTSTTGPAGHSISVRHGGTLIAQRLGGKLITNSKSGKKDTKLQDVIKAHTDHPEVQKFLKTNEARENEWAANMALSGNASKPAKGHYLMRDGRKLSGPHSPEDAVKAYKNLSNQGTDTKGVKIVHVKEAAKYKKAAEKAISLAKKAKGNKHVDTEPKLDIQDKGGTGPIQSNDNHQEEGDGKL